MAQQVTTVTTLNYPFFFHHENFRKRETGILENMTPVISCQQIEIVVQNSYPTQPWSSDSSKNSCVANNSAPKKTWRNLHLVRQTGMFWYGRGFTFS